MSVVLIKLCAGVIAVAALICGLMAARYSRKSTLVSVDPGWSFEPVVSDLKQMGWSVATIQAIQRAGELNRVALRWTVAAVILGTLSGIVGLFA